MKNQRSLLRKILKVLVDEWGHDEVANVLVGIREAPNDPAARNSAESRFRHSGVRVKPSAIAQVERAPLEGEKREAIMQLAERYDRKQFLPSVADVREFLVMMDEKPIVLKDRKDAFRTLLRYFMDLPTDRLRQLAVTAQHSGLSELGPLSDAISVASENLPRQRQDE